jgi:hypothetical protein
MKPTDALTPRTSSPALASAIAAVALAGFAAVIYVGSAVAAPPPAPPAKPAEKAPEKPSERATPPAKSARAAEGATEFEILMTLGPAAPLTPVGTGSESRTGEGGGDRTLTNETDINIGRGGGVQIQMSSQSVVGESADGKLRRFGVRRKIAGPVPQDISIEGTVEGDKVLLTMGQGELARKKTIDRPKTAVTPLEMERRMAADGIAPGKKFVFTVYPVPEDPEAPHECVWTIGDKETFKLAGKEVTVFRATMTMNIGGRAGPPDSGGAAVRTIVSSNLIDEKAQTYLVETDMGQLKMQMKRTK